MPPSRLVLFSLLTAWANLLHQLSYPEWIKGLHPIGWLLFLCSLAGIIKPSSWRIFVTLMVLRVSYTVAWIPMIRGHLFLEGLFTGGILVLIGREAWRLGRTGPGQRGDEEAWFDCFAPLLRVTTLIVYIAVTLSKLNVDFFDPQRSAAVQFLLWTERSNSFLPTGPWTRQMAIWGTLLCEAGIPLLLCWRRTRWWGLALGLAFHTLLGLTPLKIASFSLTMCLLLFSWMPRESARLIHEGWLRLSHRLSMSPRRLGLMLSGLALLTGLVYAARNGIGSQMRALDLGLGLWWWQTALMALALGWVRPARAEATWASLGQPSWLSRACLGVVVFNCLCPYLGLKTRTTLTMHCNLRTEKGHWNHLFLSERLRIFGYQDDLVMILESDLPDFAHLAQRKMPLPFFEFRRWCRLVPHDFQVRYQRGDAPPQFFERKNGVISDARLTEGSRLAEWFLCFNPVGAGHDYLPGFVRRVGPARNIVPEIPR